MLPAPPAGSDRRGQKGMLGNSCAAGICHSFSSDGRCISLLKILQSNDCIYRCKYCINRAENDSVRATFTPDEICTLVTEFYKRNYIEGLFLSSAVVRDPVYTMELMYRTLLLLRTKYAFNGYIHVKAIPYAPAELIEQTGYLADRMSINLELPTGEGAGRPCAPENPRFHPDAHAPDPEPDRGLPPGHWQGCCHGAQPGATAIWSSPCSPHATRTPPAPVGFCSGILLSPDSTPGQISHRHFRPTSRKPPGRTSRPAPPEAVPDPLSRPGRAPR